VRVLLDSAGLNPVVTGLPTGEHSVRLEGLANNCQVASANPRVVTVVSNDTTVADFTMVCARRVGSLRITTTTTGTELDSDGYVATVIGGPSQAIAINGTATIPNVREGSHAVTLSGVAANCAIAGADTVNVTVVFGATADVAFSVECVRFGTLEVTVGTTGVDVDPNGYTIEVHSPSVNFSSTDIVSPNGSARFERLRPAADYRVTLRDVSANCEVIGLEARTVAVAADATTRVAFDVSCEPARRLAVVRDDDIYVINSNGAGLTLIATSPAWDGDPAWSSTGRIAFATLRHESDAELYAINEDGTNPVRITTSVGTDDTPSWSPNGQKVVFRSSRDGNSEIYIVNADGTGLTRLTIHTATDKDPAWSSTGKIAFVSDRDHSAGEIYVMNEDGSSVVRLTNNGWEESSPAWSPDGSKIAVVRATLNCYYYCTQDIVVMNADGSSEQRLPTETVTAQEMTRLAVAPSGHTSGPPVAQHRDPAWSPNGRAIAFTRQSCPYYCDPPAVWVVNLDGTHPALITENAANPAWKP
jgi:Tol biopolymer transport system component